MARRRFFVPVVRDGKATIAGEDARHLTQVLRVEAGQIFEISDNQSAYLAEITTARKSEVDFRVLERLPDPVPGVSVHLFVSLFKFDRLELLLEKATELGVTSVQFVKAERSERGLDKAADKRIDRWRRIVLEASQQSRRVHLPALSAPVRFKDALHSTVLGEASQKLFLDEDRSGISLLSAIQPPAPSVGLMIGPEGGWPDHERAAAHAAGWRSVSMGEYILRAETAAIAALAVVNAVVRP